MDDCGSCSPEPKAVFKYDKKLGTYLPAKHIQQDFEKENFKSMEIWLAESFEKIKMENEPSLENQFHRSLKAHVVNLLWIGEEKKAWEIFNTYMPKDSFTQKVHKEIKRISNKSKFFQLLRNQK